MTWTILGEEHEKMRADCVSGFPLESCGLFIGPIDATGNPTGHIQKVWPAKNREGSARIYSIDPADMFAASRWATENNLEIVGVYHSHTHTHAYPSPTDIDQAVDPSWCYAIVSLMEPEIKIRYFSISNDEVVDLECLQV